MKNTPAILKLLAFTLLMVALCALAEHGIKEQSTIISVLKERTNEQSTIISVLKERTNEQCTIISRGLKERTKELTTQYKF